MLTNDLDNEFTVAAPEYILLRQRTAGPVTRLLAILLDQAMIFILLFVVIIVAIFMAALLSISDLLQGATVFLAFLAFFLLQWFYFLLFEWLNQGRTLGKMAVGIRVVSEDGTKPDSSQLLIRNLLRVADMFPIQLISSFLFFPSYAIGLFSLFFSGRRFQRLGDLAAGTIVIRDRERTPTKVNPSMNEQIVELATRIQLRKEISSDLAQALHDYAQSQERLSNERMNEIALQIDQPLRKLLGAESWQCEPKDILLAAHYYLYGRETYFEPDKIHRKEESSVDGTRTLSAFVRSEKR